MMIINSNLYYINILFKTGLYKVITIPYAEAAFYAA